ncbi:voltage-dependent calcium channel subunit alpha-2/delta-4-like [Dipodomys merriami]|uniref:voltage-dependent calcium channel subunit alpha-2/delta-4-like n=1 Tax=Dipodomys merriami TaxID=94247 RepID=UPI0038558E95
MPGPAAGSHVQAGAHGTHQASGQPGPGAVPFRLSISPSVRLSLLDTKIVRSHRLWGRAATEPLAQSRWTGHPKTGGLKPHVYNRPISKDQELRTGRFLGQVDGALMAQLLDMGVFSRVTMYDYQAMCKAPAQRPSAAHPLTSPLSACLALARWLMHELLLSLLEWSSWGSWLDRGAEAHKHKKQDVLHPCDTEYPVFAHQAAARQASGAIPCGACRKAFAMQQIPRSNLLLLAADPDCSCSDFPPILREASEVRYNASVKCERMRSQKPRRRPDACHAFHPEENAQDCGGASHTRPSLPLLLLTTWGWLRAPRLL